MAVLTKMPIFALGINLEKCNFMEKVTSLFELENALSIETLSKVTNYDVYFKTLAESLFDNFQIRNGNDVFRFVEIEFYLRATESESRKIAYERETSAGEWFLHDNGVDIAFESNKELKRIKRKLIQQITACFLLNFMFINPPNITNNAKVYNIIFYFSSLQNL